jgi:hypothetical protein
MPSIVIPSTPVLPASLMPGVFFFFPWIIGSSTSRGAIFGIVVFFFKPAGSGHCGRRSRWSCCSTQMIWKLYADDLEALGVMEKEGKA